MRILLIFLYFLWLANVSFAQKNYKVTYRHCFEMDTARILDMSPLYCKQATLIGNNNASMYSLNKIKGNAPNPKINSPDYKALSDSMALKKSFSISFKSGIPYDSIGDLLLYNKTTDSIFVRKKMTSEYVLTNEKTPAISWQITADTTRILNYLCLKAKCNFRGRSYDVWFAPEIPISDGPWKFKGLPGLVLSVEDNRYQVKITAESIEYPSQELVPKFYNIGKQILLKDFFDFQNKETQREHEARKMIEEAQEGYGLIANMPKYKPRDQLFQIELHGDDH